MCILSLDQRIEIDLSELYNGGITPGDILNANGLNGLIPAKPGQTSFATRALPRYYTGNRKARTVMVMLNPGIDVTVANKNLFCDICVSGMKNAGDVCGYHNWCTNFGRMDRSRFDNFDIKQAFFLHKWKKTGIRFPAGLCANPKSERQVLLDAKEIVLTQKLQLELIPYASSSFGSFIKGKIGLVFPFVETLLKEIFSEKRKYVIFCSKKFARIFREYNKMNPGTFCFIRTDKIMIPYSAIMGSCTKIHINYGKDSMDAIIANTFPSQALPNAYELMEHYGEFCYNCFTRKP